MSERKCSVKQVGPAEIIYLISNRISSPSGFHGKFPRATSSIIFFLYSQVFNNILLLCILSMLSSKKIRTKDGQGSAHNLILFSL